MGRPGDYVDGGGVESKVGDDCPLRIRRFAPDEDFTIVGRGCEDGAVFGMCLSIKEVNRW